MAGALYVISSGKQTIEKFIPIARVIYPYVTAIHLREKQRTAGELAVWVEQLLEAGVPRERLVINDRVDVAHAYHLGGVQLAGYSLSPQTVKNSFSELRVGVSVHNLQEALAAAPWSDYLLFGHVYETKSKLGLKGRGTAALKEVVEAVSVPVLAIGGIGVERVREVMEVGAHGVAVISGVLEAASPVAAVRAYRDALESFS